MKTRTKLLVAATSLCLATGAAIGTSTYAWFISNKAASVTVSDISAVTTEGALKLTISNLDNMTGTITENTAYSLTGGTMTDVSGTGKPTEFYHPVWTSEATEDTPAASSIPTVVNTGTTKYWQSFDMTIKNTGTSPIGLFLGTNTTLAANTAEADADANLLPGARLAFLHGDTIKETFSSAAIATDNYITTGASEQKLYGVAERTTATRTTKKINDFTTESTYTSAHEKTDGSVLESNIAANGEVTYKVVCWFEGEDPAVKTANVAGKIKFALHMYALNVVE